MYLAIDYGKKRIGLALGRVLPRGAGVIDASKKREAIIFEIKEICRQNEVEKIVIGLPFRNQGEAGTLAGEIQNFGRDLERGTELPVVFEPEQFTSAEAERLLQDQSYNRKSGKTDEMAAVLILEQYLGEHKFD